MTNMIEVQDEHVHSNKPLQIDEDSPAADKDYTYDIEKWMDDNKITTAPDVVTIRNQLTKVTKGSATTLTLIITRTMRRTTDTTNQLHCARIWNYLLYQKLGE